MAVEAPVIGRQLALLSAWYGPKPACQLHAQHVLQRFSVREQELLARFFTTVQRVLDLRTGFAPLPNAPG